MVEQTINDAIKVLEGYQNISHIVDLNKAQSKWIDKLIKNEISDSDIDSTFNLLNLAIHKIKSLELGIKNQAEEILNNVDRYLKIIYDYDEDTIKNYSDKLININGKHMFSTLTELAIADYYKQNNYKVDYFFKYYLEYGNGKIKQKDFDIHVIYENFNMLIEVYMPTYTPDYEEVFFGDYDIDIESLREHIYKKAEQKFDLKKSPQIRDFKYPLIFAINTHYDAMLQTQLYIPFKIKKLYQNLEAVLKDFPKISGIMLVETDFTKKESKLILHKMIWNPISTG